MNDTLPQHTDNDRADFLTLLDEAVDTVEVSDWEAQFVSSNLSRGHFSTAQREIIDRMIQSYGKQLGW